ncbi:Arginine biosynthesis bifunctional protein ArgJ, chloroplastic [Apostasia shenzhenica]|uniref:Arginine biosynthesis bifunctional protein ArgJ, chloroplastic n=1 Tax=Apostasia shenzhenica TaxID=1088818 RepID=A0A2I0AJP6_9ASPA|nr:Arginine biosynthesis bifunctional protein ArgJ, chloroplastic [Apostasia shenzhenica]
MVLSLSRPISLGAYEKFWCLDGSSRHRKRVSSIVCMDVDAPSRFIPTAPILVPEGPWKQIPGGVTAAKGFKAAGIFGGLRAKGEKPDLALARAVLINAGQANAATGDAGYHDVVECAHSVAKLLQLNKESVLVQSTGVIGQRIKKEALLKSLPRLLSSLSATVEGADSAAVAITTTDLVSKSVAVEAEVDGDTSTNDSVIALASGLAGLDKISSLNSTEAVQLQACLDSVMQGLAKSIAWDGEGATCLLEVTVSGANNEAEASKIARTVASSSLVKAAVYGRDPNWGRIACAVGYAGIDFDLNALQLSLGDIPLMHSGQPLPFDRAGASSYLRMAGDTHGTVEIHISVGMEASHISSMLPLHCCKIIHLVRHAQGIHNVEGEKNHNAYLKEELFDARLTPRGWKQVDNLRKHVIACGLSKKIDLVITSPLLRTMQTAAGVFGGQSLVDGVKGPPLMVENVGNSDHLAISSLDCPPFIAVEACREHLGVHPCDRRRTISDYKKLFPAVDFSLVNSTFDYIRLEQVKWVENYGGFSLGFGKRPVANGSEE